MARQWLVILQGLDGRVDRSAGVMAKHQNERRTEHGYRVFQTRNRLVGSKISGHPADKEVAAAAVKGVFRRDARVGAAQDSGIGVLAADQSFPFALEVVTRHYSLDIALVSLQQTLQGRFRREQVF